MSTSYRVRQDDFSPKGEVIDNLPFAVDFVRGSWRIYEQYSDYNPVTGGHIRKGNVVRRYDPDAGASEGKPASFDTKEAAFEYARKWLTKRVK